MRRKRTNKILKALAKHLPVQRYEYMQNYSINGGDIERTGLNVPDGMEISPENEYNYSSIATNEVNHFRRLRRSFEKGGKAAVYKYIVPFIPQDQRAEMLRFVHGLPL